MPRVAGRSLLSVQDSSFRETDAGAKSSQVYELISIASFFNTNVMYVMYKDTLLSRLNLYSS